MLPVLSVATLKGSWRLQKENVTQWQKYNMTIQHIELENMSFSVLCFVRHFTGQFSWCRFYISVYKQTILKKKTNIKSMRNWDQRVLQDHLNIHQHIGNSTAKIILKAHFLSQVYLLVKEVHNLLFSLPSTQWKTYVHARKVCVIVWLVLFVLFACMFGPM